MKTKQSRKKKGGAYGLVLNIGYNDDNDITNVKSQQILDPTVYSKANHHPPKYSRQFWGMFENLGDSVNDFFNPFDTNKRTKKKYVKIAVNDKKHLRLINLTNQIIKGLNRITTTNSAATFRIIRDKNGKINDLCKLDFIEKYRKLLITRGREFLSGLLDDNKDILEKEGDETDDEPASTIRHLLKMPFLVNVISIKYGLLKNGDVTLKELYNIFRPSGIKKFVRTVKSSMSYEDIIKEENRQLMEENNKLVQMRIQRTTPIVVSPRGGPIGNIVRPMSRGPIGNIGRSMSTGRPIANTSIGLNGPTQKEQNIQQLIQKDNSIINKFTFPKELDGVKVYKAPADGNCFFHSVAHQLHDLNPSLNQQMIRDACADYLQSTDDYNDVLETGNDVLDKPDYIQALKTRLWGGHLEMTFIQNGCLDKLIHSQPLVFTVFKPEGKQLVRYNGIEVPNDPTTRRPIRLLYTGGVHYDGLYFDDGKDHPITDYKYDKDEEYNDADIEKALIDLADADLQKAIKNSLSDF